MKEQFLVPIKRIIFKFDGPADQVFDQSFSLSHFGLALNCERRYSPSSTSDPRSTNGSDPDRTRLWLTFKKQKKERNKSVDYPPRNNPMSINECDPDRAHKSALSAVLQCDPNEMGKHTFLPDTIIWFKSTYLIYPSSSYVLYSIKDKWVSLVSLYFKMMSWI